MLVYRFLKCLLEWVKMALGANVVLKHVNYLNVGIVIEIGNFITQNKVIDLNCL
jgi:hypothetical protein